MDSSVVFGFEVPKPECHENLRNFKSTTLALDHPLRHRLMEIDWSGHRHIGLQIFETGFLKRPVRTHVERVRLAKQPFQLQSLKVDFDAAANAFSADALLSTLGRADMQVHIRALAKYDLVAT